MNHTSLRKLPVLVLCLFLAQAAVSSADETSTYTYDFATNPLTAAEAPFLPSNAAAVVWVQNDLREGKGALKLTNTDQTKNVNVLGPLVPFTGGKLTVAVEAKTENAVFGTQPWEKASLQILYYDEDKKRIDYKWKGYSDIVPFTSGTVPWDNYTKVCFLPASAKVAYAQVCITEVRTTGTVWVDKISLVAQP